MESFGETVQEAHFWQDSAGQLRQIAHEPIREMPVSERLLALADEYERLADKLVENWGHTPDAAPIRAISRNQMRA
jgi:hypothetical protein